LSATLLQPEAAIRQSSARLRWSQAAVVALLLVIYLGSAFSPALMDDADSTHAEVAREMLARHDFVTLHVNGVRYLEKAPLLYWLVTLSYRIFGVNAFATRLPIVLAVLLTALLAMRWARRAFGARAGTYAGLFVATTAGYYLFTRILIPEAVLSLCIAAAMYAFVTALEEENSDWRWYAGYACLALAVLTKGLFPLIVIGGTVIFYAAITGEWRRWREFRLGTGLLLFLAIAAPWHVLAGIRNRHFFWFYFVNEHFLRFIGKRYPLDYNKLPTVLYWSLHLVWLFPWSVFLPLAVRRLWLDFRIRGGRRPLTSGCDKAEASDAALTFSSRTKLVCVLWAGILLTFFAFSTNQEYYTVPAYFPILLLLAYAVADAEETGNSRWLVPTTAVMFVLSLAAAGILIAGLWSSRHMAFAPDIGAVLAKTNPKTDTLSMGHMLNLTGQSFAALRFPAILATIVLLAGPAVAFVIRRRGGHATSTWAMAATMGLFLIAAHVALVRFDPYLSSRDLASQIEREIKPEDCVAIYGDQAFGSSLLFYLKRPIYLANGRTTSMWFGSTFPDAPHIFLSDGDLLRMWSSPRRVFLFVPPQNRAQLDGLIASKKYLIAESSGKVIYSNRGGR
jgi:4-amino-4-deoxy-L-arabinose transferase-like glycosyltransferase